MFMNKSQHLMSYISKMITQIYRRILDNVFNVTLYHIHFIEPTSTVLINFILPFLNRIVGKVKLIHIFYIVA